MKPHKKNLKKIMISLTCLMKNEDKYKSEWNSVHSFGYLTVLIPSMFSKNIFDGKKKITGLYVSLSLTNVHTHTYTNTFIESTVCGWSAPPGARQQLTAPVSSNYISAQPYSWTANIVTWHHTNHYQIIWDAQLHSDHPLRIYKVTSATLCFPYCPLLSTDHMIISVCTLKLWLSSCWKSELQILSVLSAIASINSIQLKLRCTSHCLSCRHPCNCYWHFGEIHPVTGRSGILLTRLCFLIIDGL